MLQLWMERVMSRERRVELRASERRPTQLRCWVGDQVVDRFVSACELSAAGARLVTATPPRVGERITVRFDVPGSAPPAPLRARVVWRTEGFRGRGGVMGIAFDEPSDLLLGLAEGRGDDSGAAR